MRRKLQIPVPYPPLESRSSGRLAASNGWKIKSDSEEENPCYYTASNYCQSSTLHGLKYVGDNRLHLIERSFWLVAFLLGVSAATYYISFLYEKWKDNPVIVSLSATTTPLVDIPFPAVTVCSMNRAKKSVVASLSQPLERRLLDNVCDHNNISDPSENEAMNWETVQNFIVKVSQPCHEMLLFCSYGGLSKDCNNLFNTALTDEGICCSFNMVHREYLYRNPRNLSDLNVTFPFVSVDWTPDKGYPENTAAGTLPYRPRGRGSNLGLTLILDSCRHDYYCSTTSGVGFKIILHNPVETPKIANFAVVFSPGYEVRMAIKPHIRSATTPLRHIPVRKRQCLFGEEKKLKFYRTYTQRNCALECESNFTLQQCACVLSYMPKDSKTLICATPLQLTCAYDKRKALEISLDETDNYTDIMPQNKPSCKCLPGCNDLQYTSFMSYSKFSAEDHIPKKYYEKLNNFTYFSNSAAVVHLFFTESQFTSSLKGELFGFIDFLSSTGGLLGLFLGFSFMSVAEALYFLTFRLWCAMHRNRKKENSYQFSFPIFKRSINPYPFTQ